MPIDTDDLSDATYNAIIAASERFDHNLTLQFGLLSYHCDDESEFIEKSEELIAEMLDFNLDNIDDMFFGEPPTKAEFHRMLNKLLVNIAQLKK